MECSSSTLIDLEFDQNLEVSCSYQEWYRLRESWTATLRLQELRQNYSNQLEQFITEDRSYRNYASEVQNSTIQIKILENFVALAREKIRILRYRINAYLDENERVHQDKNQQLDMTSVTDEMAKKKQQNSEDKLKLARQQNELIFRRRYMFKGLNEIFFPKLLKNQPMFKKNCYCLKYDLIHGLHLPTVAARLGHNDVELCAATGFLIQLLRCASEILFFPLKHLIFFNGSRSILLTRSTLERHDLFNNSSSFKSSRDRFDHALYLLCEVVVQLRADCGVSTRELDRPIRLLRELLSSFIGGHRFSRSDLIMKIGKISSFSPSIYIGVDNNDFDEQKKTSDTTILYNYLMPSLQTF